MTVDITPDHEFIILACDGEHTTIYITGCYTTDCIWYNIFITGVWDVMSNIEVVEFIRRNIATNMKPPLVRAN